MRHGYMRNSLQFLIKYLFGSIFIFQSCISFKTLEDKFVDQPFNLLLQNTKDNPPCNTLFIGNLGETVVEEELRGLFTL
jgi:hypothetical protein